MNLVIVTQGRRKLLLGVFLLIAVAAVAASIGRAVTASDGAAGSWTWAQQVPGEKITASRIVTLAASASGVDGSSVYEIGTGQSGHGSLALLAGKNASGDVCIGFTQNDEASVLQFQCLAPNDPREILWAGGDGGGALNSTDWVSVSGVARNDVDRVVIALSDGTTRDLALNKWRAFSYYTDSMARPTSLIAFRSNGGKVADIDLRAVVESAGS
jgi:hypothetical protein